jgi:threonine synthase
MRATVGLLSYFATKRNRRITLLVSTTGDTGPAAVQAVADIANPLLTILVHYPEGQISPFQRKQMTCIASDVVIVATFQGGGDDMDLPIKNMLTQQDMSSGRYLAGVNSYNFARPMAQIVHHVSLENRGFSPLRCLIINAVFRISGVDISSSYRTGRWEKDWGRD